MDVSIGSCVWGARPTLGILIGLGPVVWLAMKVFAEETSRTLPRRPRCDGIYVGECGFQRWLRVGHHTDRRNVVGFGTRRSVDKAPSDLHAPYIRTSTSIRDLEG